MQVLPQGELRVGVLDCNMTNLFKHLKSDGHAQKVAGGHPCGGQHRQGQPEWQEAPAPARPRPGELRPPLHRRVARRCAAVVDCVARRGRLGQPRHPSVHDRQDTMSQPELRLMSPMKSGFAGHNKTRTVLLHASVEKITLEQLATLASGNTTSSAWASTAARPGACAPTSSSFH